MVNYRTSFYRVEQIKKIFLPIFAGLVKFRGYFFKNAKIVGKDGSDHGENQVER